MGKICKNCRYFEVKSVEGGKSIWGICFKPKDGGFKAKARKKGGVFQWGENNCPEFKGAIAPSSPRN
jgi:hypothetical protein